MHTLISCAVCKRQYDAANLTIGAQFRCRCGQAITVPRVTSRDAAVVRCASCGGPREAGRLSCSYCGSDFTLHEQDLETICPACLARISNAAKFCHHCATPIAPEEIAAEATDRSCPACGPSYKLQSRALGDSGFSALECTRCAGLWVGEGAFEALEARERETAAPAADAKTIREELKSRPRVATTPGPFYRACPVCATAMTRINFSRISGILIDRCREHGIWFDATELDAALRWIQIGGEKAAQRRDADEAKSRASQERFKIALPNPNEMRGSHVVGADEDTEWQGKLIPWILGSLFK